MFFTKAIQEHCGYYISTERIITLMQESQVLVDGEEIYDMEFELEPGFYTIEILNKEFQLLVFKEK